MVKRYALDREVRDTNPRGRRLETLLKMADLDRVLPMIPREEQKVVVLHGMLDLPLYAVERLLDLSRPTVIKRFAGGIESLTKHLNGDTAL